MPETIFLDLIKHGHRSAWPRHLRKTCSVYFYTGKRECVLELSWWLNQYKADWYENLDTYIISLSSFSSS